MQQRACAYNYLCTTWYREKSFADGTSTYEAKYNHHPSQLTMQAITLQQHKNKENYSERTGKLFRKKLKKYSEKKLEKNSQNTGEVFRKKCITRVILIIGQSFSLPVN